MVAILFWPEFSLHLLDDAYLVFYTYTATKS